MKKLLAFLKIAVLAPLVAALAAAATTALLYG
jgi:hypothetical protein